MVLGYPSVAVVGAFRSGTNFLQYLLEQNYRCRVVPNAYGWKHAPVAITRRRAVRFWDGRVPIFAVMKPPLDFLQSLFRYHREVGRNIAAPKEWGAFLEEPITIFNGRRGRTAELSFANPIDYWNCLYLNLTNLPKAAFRSRLVLYPDLKAEPEAEVLAVAAFSGLNRRAGAFRLPNGPLARGVHGWKARLSGRSTQIACPADVGSNHSEPLPEFTEAQRRAALARVHPALVRLLSASTQGAAA